MGGNGKEGDMNGWEGMVRGEKWGEEGGWEVVRKGNRRDAGEW